MDDGYTPDELAESYMNGNLAFVGDQLKDDALMALLTVQVLADAYGHEDALNRITRLVTKRNLA